MKKENVAWAEAVKVAGSRMHSPKWCKGRMESVLFSPIPQSYSVLSGVGWSKNAETFKENSPFRVLYF